MTATGDRTTGAVLGALWSWTVNPFALSKEGAMSSVQPLVDAAGRRRSPATMPGLRAAKARRNKGQRYPADPPTVEEIVEHRLRTQAPVSAL